MINLKGYTFRLTEYGDAARVQKKFGQQISHLENLYGPIDFARICEVSLFSLVALSPEGGLIGFAAFDDKALFPHGIAHFPQELTEEETASDDKAIANAQREAQAMHWATRTATGIGFREEMLLWLVVCVTTFGRGADEEALVRAMLYTVLSLSYETRMILHTSSLELGALPSLFRAVARNREFKFTLCVCTRSDVLPFLQIRRAREEDHDDLCPVIERAQKRGLPLTSIPQSAVPSKSYSVARFIRAQTAENSVFVAEVAGKIVGLIVIVCDVHLPSLHENYEIDVFEGLCAKRIERKKTVIEVEAPPVDPFAVDPLASLVPDPQTPTETAGESEPEPEPEPAVEVIIRWPENVFRVAMLCMDEEFESRSIDMIEYGFKVLKKEFCLVTLPYTSPYHPLLKFFYRAKSKPNVQNQDPELSADNRCLYLLHVDGLSPDLGVRHATESDLPQLEELLDDFADKDDLLSFITKPMPGRVDMVAAVPEQIVGYVLLAGDPPVEAIASHFDVMSLLDLQYHPAEKHISLILFVINPIYRCRTRLFLQKIMRLLGKTVLYCPVFANQEVPDILEDLILLPGRQHGHMLPSCYWEKASRESTPAAGQSKTRSEASQSGVDQSGPGQHQDESGRKLSFVEDILKRRTSISFSKVAPKVVVRVEPVPYEFTRPSHRKSIIINDSPRQPDDEEESDEEADHPVEEASSSDKSGSESPVDSAPETPKEASARKLSIGVGFEADIKNLAELTTLRDEDGEGTQATVKGSQLSVKKSSFREASAVHDASAVGRKSSLKHAEAGGQVETPTKSGQSRFSVRTSLVAGNLTTVKKSVTLNIDQKQSVFLEGTTESVASIRATNTIRAASKTKQARGSYFGFDCACFTMTHKYLYRYRTTVNARVVVVGSSMTTAAFFNQLITSHVLQFTNLTMVSSVGLKCLNSTALSQVSVDLGPAYAFAKLGLDCHINVVVATVMGIDRKGHLIELSNGEIMTYDWLVLSTGLQDQTRNRIGLSPLRSDASEHIGVVKTDELILNAHEISQGMALYAVEGDTIPPVVIYGSTLEAFCAVQKLLQEGLQGPNMVLIHPEPVDLATAAGEHLGDAEVSAILVDTLLRSGVAVHSGLKLVGVEMNEEREWIRMLKFEEQVSQEQLDGMSTVPMTLEEMNKVMASKPVERSVPTHTEVPLCPIHKSQPVVSVTRRESKITFVVEKSRRPTRPLEQPCSLLVTCDKKQVDLSLFHALNRESIIFDSRVVVDGVFRTNDPSIFAAGSLCKFSRYCGQDLPKLDVFCGWEVGEAFAAAFAVLITQAMFQKEVPADHGDGFVPRNSLPPWPAPLLPSVSKGKCIGGCVPGDKWFFATAAPKYTGPSAGELLPAFLARSQSVLESAGKWTVVAVVELDVSGGTCDILFSAWGAFYLAVRMPNTMDGLLISGVGNTCQSPLF
ncbi:hypothetical protein R1sor_027499 [Riccia sorocarpa]|uniref:Cilia- and flagella-associated protein 61 N-terminal domain-containing protein n=1 Tax=Riccia sorocarpa TaxID=122646 RepID=A0ABD3GG25_9MARC